MVAVFGLLEFLDDLVDSGAVKQLGEPLPPDHLAATVIKKATDHLRGLFYTHVPLFNAV